MPLLERTIVLGRPDQLNTVLGFPQNCKHKEMSILITLNRKRCLSLRGIKAKCGSIRTKNYLLPCCKILLQNITVIYTEEGFPN